MAENYLIHHGILGQKWGIRRFQNKDGSLTSAGKTHYNKTDTNEEKSEKKSKLSDKQKKAIKIGAAVVGTTLVAGLGYKYLKDTGILQELGSNKLLSGMTEEGSVEISEIKNAINEMSEISETSVHFAESLGTTPRMESISNISQNVNKLQGKDRVNSCFQTALATHLSENSIQMTAKADLDINGLGKEHLTTSELLQIFPQLETAPKAIREFSNTDIGSSKESITKSLKEWYGDNAKGIVSTEIYNESLQKYVGHTFNWTIKDGLVSMKDNTRSEGFDALSHFDRKGEYKGPLDVIRLDQMTEINGLQALKFTKTR